MTGGEAYPESEPRRPFTDKVPSRLRKQAPWWAGGLLGAVATVGVFLWVRVDSYAKKADVVAAVDAKASTQAERDKGQDERTGRLEVAYDKIDGKLDRIMVELRRGRR